jgi:deoxyribonuclease-4
MFLSNICSSESKSRLNYEQTTSWLVPTLSKKDKEMSLKLLTDNNRQFIVHSPLSLNLAGDKSLAVAKVLNQQLIQISDLPASCVVHIGKVGTIEDVVLTLDKIELPQLNRNQDNFPNHQLLLETAAGKGTELGSNWKQVRKLYELLDTKKIGICLDTAHLFVSSMSTLSSHESIVKLFDRVESICGKTDLIHLNGSSYEFGAKNDKHQALCSNDYIWTNDEDKEGLKSLIVRCQDDTIPIICETHNFNSDVDTLNEFGYDIEV